jgi:hypothetical protein
MQPYLKTSPAVDDSFHCDACLYFAVAKPNNYLFDTLHFTVG